MFFLERTVEAYKTVFFLYNHPDLEYHLDTSPIGNNVRFEVIQILKKGLFFDPEFWSLLNIKTNCLKLMSDDVARAAREIMEEDKWVPGYCVREHCKCRTELERTVLTQEAKPGSRDEQESGTVEKPCTSPSGDASSEVPQYKKRGRKPGTRLTKNLELFPVRRSFRQLDLAQNHARQLNNRCQRFLTRQADKNILKQRGRKPRWLLEQLASLGENSAPGQRKKPGRKPKLFSSLKDILVDTPVIEITMEYSYPDNEVELPADVQGRSTSRSTTSSTEHRFDQPQTAPCSKTPNSLLQMLLEKSPHSWADKDDFQSQEVMVMIRKFHTYTKVPEEEESPTLVPLTDTVVLAAQHAAKQEEDLHTLAPVKSPNEPDEGIQVTSVTAAVTQEVGGGSDPSSLSPREQHVVPADSKVGPPKDQTTSVETDKIQVLEDTQEVSGLAHKPDSATEYICTTSEKGTDVLSTSGNPLNATPGLAPQSKVSTLKEILENPPEVKEAVDVSKNASEAEIVLKTPAALEEAKPQETASQQTAEAEPEPEPTQNTASSPISSAQTPVQPKRQCKLCNKTYETPLSHALWHYRTEKRCMFCDKLAMTRGALQHFQKHIKNDLSQVEGPVETKKSEGVPEATGSPDQTAQESPPKKAKPGFAQIKSRLLMRLKLTRKAQPQRETEKSSDNSGTLLKETETADTKKPVSEPEQKESSVKNEKQTAPQETIRYLTRGSVKKSEHKVRLRRTERGRKAKAAPRDGFVPRVNGVVRRKLRMWCLQEDSCPATDKNVPPVKEENKTDAEKTIRSNKASYAIRTKSDKATSNNIDGESKNCAKAKALEEPRVKRKKHDEDEEKVDVKSAKKRKNEDSTSNAKSTDTAEETNSVPKQQNGTEAESSETSKTVRKRKVSSTPVVSCPIDMCTFQAMPGPVLSHVLIHHAGDTKALEFFYNFAAKKCLFCARRIWTPQHFFDHVISHRGNLKHPCYHTACQKRFKTRMDVGDHMEKDHNPLRAQCCFPGCTVESGSLKDLYSHEKSHYKAATLKKDKSESFEKAVDKPSLRASRGKSTPTAAPQADERVTPETTTTTTTTPPSEIKEQKTDPVPVNQEDETPLTLNRSTVNYSSKSSQLVNGHTEHAQESGVKAPPTAPKEQEPKYEKVIVKPFGRLPPSAYLDELYLSMPKKWRGPQVSTKGSDADEVSPVKKQSCSRCNAAFECEEELQLHREKCTSLFGFDSDDESKCRLEPS